MKTPAMPSNCVIDHKPKHLEPYEIELLVDMARVVANNLEKKTGRRMEVV